MNFTNEDLKKLIENSMSCDQNEKNFWLWIYENLPENNKINLFNILFEEKKQLDEIENKFNEIIKNQDEKIETIASIEAIEIITIADRMADFCLSHIENWGFNSSDFQEKLILELQKFQTIVRKNDKFLLSNF